MNVNPDLTCMQKSLSEVKFNISIRILFTPVPLFSAMQVRDYACFSFMQVFQCLVFGFFLALPPQWSSDICTATLCPSSVILFELNYKYNYWRTLSSIWPSSYLHTGHPRRGLTEYNFLWLNLLLFLIELCLMISAGPISQFCVFTRPWNLLILETIYLNWLVLQQLAHCKSQWVLKTWFIINLLHSSKMWHPPTSGFSHQWESL